MVSFGIGGNIRSIIYLLGIFILIYLLICGLFYGAVRISDYTGTKGKMI
jgi:hypothetical protein